MLWSQPTTWRDAWQYVRDPLPSRFEDSALRRIRDNLEAEDTRWQFNPESLEKLSLATRRVQLQNGLLPDYGDRFNPMLRCIVRRTRAYLEATINPATGSYFLPKVTVKLFGEKDEGALVLGGYLREAYQEAEEFSQLLQKRVRGGRFFQDSAVAAARQFHGSRATYCEQAPGRRTRHSR